MASHAKYICKKLKREIAESIGISTFMRNLTIAKTMQNFAEKMRNFFLENHGKMVLVNSAETLKIQRPGDAEKC